jgi:hypothetical protein
MYNLLIEFVEDEKARFEKKTLTSMQDELQRSQHIITRLNEQLYALREESSKYTIFADPRGRRSKTCTGFRCWRTSWRM